MTFYIDENSEDFGVKRKLFSNFELPENVRKTFVTKLRSNGAISNDEV